jgi:phosphoserine phosphatase
MDEGIDHDEQGRLRAMKLYLVRHGVTPYNKEDRFQGRIDIPLDDEGKAQAECLGERFRDEVTKGDEHFAGIYVSPLSRTQETAEPIGKALNMTPRKEPQLIELGMGEWEGKTKAEVIQNYKDADGTPLLKKCSTDPLHNPMPGGETLQEVDRRITSSLEGIIKSHLPSESAVVVTHGGAIAVALCHVLGKSLGEVPHSMVDNASVTVIETESDLDHAKLLERNDTSHLESFMSPYIKKS